MKWGTYYICRFPESSSNRKAQACYENPLIRSSTAPQAVRTKLRSPIRLPTLSYTHTHTFKKKLWLLRTTPRGLLRDCGLRSCSFFFNLISCYVTLCGTLCRSMQAGVRE